MSMPATLMRRLSESENPDSFANRLRSRRFQRFEGLVATLPRPLKILDVGGTNAFWEFRGWAERKGVEILTLNLQPELQQYENIRPLVGDATNLAQFEDGSFDVVFSNSVIEHLFTFENQRRMAAEVQRVGKAFWVQTPNYWFPMEPHFQVPAWQWMPLELRVLMIRRWRCGWRGPCDDRVAAHRLVEEVRLLKKDELRAIFPGATLLAEKFCGLVKSWTAVGGFPPDRTNGMASPWSAA